MQRRFTVDLDGLKSCQEFIASLCDSPRPQIIMDEIVSNIVRCSGATFFSVDCTISPENEMTLVFSDDGSAFDPTAAAAPDLATAAEDRQIGGLGIFMVKKMSKSVSYARTGDLNVLTVVMPV